jgi:hypothetical protein
MADIPDNLRYLIEALRTPSSPRSITPQTGSRAGQSIATGNPNLHPIEQRRDGYRQYLNEFRAGTQEGDPMSYEEWISQEQ